MCGRYGRTTPAAVFAEMIEAEVSQRLGDDPGYNLPPGTFQPIVLHHPDTDQRTLGPAFWGFVPGFMTDDKLKPINARSDKLSGRFFHKAYSHQRCLVPVDWWYEWRKEGDAKQPYLLRPTANNPFFFAGIWSKASSLPSDHKASGQVTFAIITREPHLDIAHIHNRQPAALTREAAREWIGGGNDTADLDALLAEGCYDNYTSWPVTRKMGNPTNNGPEITDEVRT